MSFKSSTALIGVLVVLIVVAGVAGYYAGSAAAPVRTVTSTAVSTTTVTKTVTVTVTAAPAPTPTPSPTPTPTRTLPAKYELHVAVASAPIPCDLNPYGECDPHNLLVKVFKDEVERSSGGAVRIVIHTAGELGGEPDYVEMMRAGDLLLSVMSPIVFVTRVPELAWAQWPGLFRTLEQVKEFSETDLAKEKLKVCEKAGLICVMFSPGGTRIFYTVPGKVIKAPEDVKGLKLRTIAPGVIELFKYLGALPAALPLAEVYTALQTRTIDGCEFEPPYALSVRIYEVAPNVAVVPLYVMFHVTVMSKKLYESLPPDIQKIIMDAAIKATKVKTDWYMRWERIAIEEMKKRGANVIEPDKETLQKWNEVLNKFLEATKDKVDPKVYEWCLKYFVSRPS